MITLEMFIKECGSREAAARKLQISVRTIYRWQTGKFKISPVMARWIQTNGINADWSLVDVDKVK